MKKIYPFFLVHSGCRHRCEFCNQKVSSGCDTASTPEDVKFALSDESLSGISEVAFYGGSFTLLPQSVQLKYLSAVTQSIQDGRVGGIRISTRPDAIDEKTLVLLKENGVTTVELGCQTFDNSILTDINRGHLAEDILDAMSLLNKVVFQVGLQLMVGLPNESLRGSANSVKSSVDLFPDFIRIFPLLVLKGSILESRWRAGRYTPLSLESAVKFCADVLLYSYRRGVAVARIGLHNTPSMDADSILAGPRHPAFGQLVKSELWARAFKNCNLKNFDDCGIVNIYVAENDLSDAIGHERKNLAVLTTEELIVNISSNKLIHKGSFHIGTTPYSMMEVTSYEYSEFWN